MYCGVPRISPNAERRSPVVGMMSRTRPKSVIRRRGSTPFPRRVRRRFAGFMSRWTIFRSCACARPSRTLEATQRARLGVKDLAEVLALRVLHHDEVEPALLVEVVHLDDRRVVELRRRARLALEAHEVARDLHEARVEDLHGHVAVEPEVMSAVHGADRARAAALDEEAAPQDRPHEPVVVGERALRACERRRELVDAVRRGLVEDPQVDADVGERAARRRLGLHRQRAVELLFREETTLDGGLPEGVRGFRHVA
jgi:hypothetical protein